MTRKEYNELTEPQIELYNLVQEVRKKYSELELTKKQIAELLVNEYGYGTSEVTIYNRIARIKGI